MDTLTVAALATGVVGIVLTLLFGPCPRLPWALAIVALVGAWLAGYLGYGMAPLTLGFLLLGTGVVVGAVAWWAKPVARADPRTQALDDLGVSGVSAGSGAWHVEISAALRAAQEIVILMPAGFNPLQLFGADLKAALSRRDAGAIVTLLVPDPHPPHIDGVDAGRHGTGRADWVQRMGQDLRGVVDQASKAVPRGDTAQRALSLRVCRDLARSDLVIACDKRLWFAPYVAAGQSQPSAVCELETDTPLWQDAWSLLRDLEAPHNSFRVPLGAPLPVATHAMGESVTVKPDDLHSHVVPGSLILSQEGSIAVWVQLPQAGERQEGCSHKYIWAASRAHGNTTKDTVALYHLTRRTDGISSSWSAFVDQWALSKAEADGTAIFASRGPHILASDNLAPGPHHFTVVWSQLGRATLTLWIDGERQPQVSLMASGEPIWPTVMGKHLSIGHFPNGDACYCPQWPLSGFAVFDKALTQNEILAWMETTRPE